MQGLSDVFSTIDAKYNFILGCIRVAGADGEVCPDEANYLTLSAQQLGLGLDRVTDAFEVAKNRSEPVKLETPKEKLFLLKELIQIQEFHPIFQDRLCPQVTAGISLFQNLMN